MTIFDLSRVKAAQSELGTQILADFEEAFPSQGSKVNISIQTLHFHVPTFLIYLYFRINTFFMSQTIIIETRWAQ